jgi:hypothetical protein
MDNFIRRRRIAKIMMFVSFLAVPTVISFSCSIAPYISTEAFNYFCSGTIVVLCMCALYPIYYYLLERKRLKTVEANLMGARLAYFVYSPEEWVRMADAHAREEEERSRIDDARHDTPSFHFFHNSLLFLCVAVVVTDLLAGYVRLSLLLPPMLALLALMNAFRLAPLRIRRRRRSQLRDPERSVYVGKAGVLESWGRYIPYRTRSRVLSRVEVEKPSPSEQNIVLWSAPLKGGKSSGTEAVFYRLPVPRKQFQRIPALVESMGKIMEDW